MSSIVEISTLILSFAPMMIWPRSTSHSFKASPLPTLSPSHSPPTHSPSHSPPTLSPSHSPPTHSQARSQLPSPHGGHPNHLFCLSPTATATRRAFCDPDNPYHVPLPQLKVYSTTSSETRISSPASEQPSVDSAFTTESLSSSETGRQSEASGSVAAQSRQDDPTSSSRPHETSSSPRVKIGAGIGIGLGILILIAVVAILWFRRRQKQNQRRVAAEGLECEPKPSFEENSAKSPRVQPEAISTQDRSWLGDGRNVSPETHSLPLIGPRLTPLNTAIPRKNDLKSSSASKLITTSIASPGLLGDANAAFKFLDQSAPVAVPPTLAKEARSPVSPEQSPEQSPLGYFSNAPPSPEEILPPLPNTSQENPSVDLDPSPLATKNSLEFYLPILQQESKDATTTPLTSPSMILNSPQKSITTDVKRTGQRAQHLRDHPQPLRSYSSASRGTLADPPNHREPSIGNNNTAGSSNFTPGRSNTVKDSSSSSLDANNDDPAAAIQNFSRKIGSIRSRQVREVTGPPAVHSHVDARL